MTELPNDIETLKALVKELLEKIKRLEAENAELRRRLGLDSTNSHKPPSSEGYQKKPLKPGIPKPGKHCTGGQKGHRGKTLKRVEHPDQIQVHRPAYCQCCGRQFSANETYEIVQSRQVFDLPVSKLEVTEHRLAQIECCRIVQHGEYPKTVTATVQYGAGVRALVTKLSVEHKMPLKQISQLFEDLYGYELNSTTIEETLQRGYRLAEPLEHQIRTRMHAQELMHADETGVRVAGTLHWLHTATSANYTHLFIHKQRGIEALKSEASVLKAFKGTVVHDCWSPYFHFDAARHVLCGAHLLRELNNLMEQGTLWAGELHEFLLDLYRMPHSIATAAEEVQKHYHLILSQAEREEPPPQPGKRGKPKQSTGRNLLNRLKKHQDGVLAFALDPKVPFTNNQAERDLRPAKVKQKVSGCFRTLTGAEVYARLQAMISTFRKQELNVFIGLRDLFLMRPIMLV